MAVNVNIAARVNAVAIMLGRPPMVVPSVLDRWMLDPFLARQLRADPHMLDNVLGADDVAALIALTRTGAP